jgi:DNA-binding IclR family transcriptional regulator
MESSSNLKHAGPIKRAMVLLRALATAGPRGLPLSRLALDSGLPPSTVHRLLSQLVSEGAARQIDETRCYALGQIVFELGLAAEQQFDLRAACRPAVERLALEAGDTVYVVIRSGDEAVCIERHEGPSPIRVMTLQVGSRRPLGLGAGGLAILAALPELERNAILNKVAPPIANDHGIGPKTLRDSLAAAQRQGYSLIRNRITPGVTAIGIPFFDSLHRPLGAISIAAINARMTPAHLAILRPQLHKAARAIESALSWT